MKFGLLTSGGDAPGMNAAIRAFVRQAGITGHKVYGIRGGFAGLFQESILPLDDRSVANILQQGGTILGSGRCPRFFDPDARAEAAGLLRRKGIDALAVIGGDGSYQGLQSLHEETGLLGVGLPGTIDNDIGGTDATIGFDTAVNTALDAIDRIRDTAFSHDRLFFVEVMGRHSGAIAAAVGLAGGAEGILVPETETDLDQLARSIDRGAEMGKLASIIIVAEGDEKGDARTIAAAIKQRLRYPADCRVTVLGHVQRGGKPTAADRILASRLGAYAVDCLGQSEAPVAVGTVAGRLTATSIAQTVGPSGDDRVEYVRLAGRLAGRPKPQQT